MDWLHYFISWCNAVLQFSLLTSLCQVSIRLSPIPKKKSTFHPFSCWLGEWGVEATHLCIHIFSFILVLICCLRLKFKGDRWDVVDDWLSSLDIADAYVSISWQQRLWKLRGTWLWGSGVLCPTYSFVERGLNIARLAQCFAVLLLWTTFSELSPWSFAFLHATL